MAVAEEAVGVVDAVVEVEEVFPGHRARRQAVLRDRVITVLITIGLHGRRLLRIVDHHAQHKVVLPTTGPQRARMLGIGLQETVPQRDQVHVLILATAHQRDQGIGPIRERVLEVDHQSNPVLGRVQVLEIGLETVIVLAMATGQGLVIALEVGIVQETVTCPASETDPEMATGRG